MSYLVEHPWDQYGQPPPIGWGYDENRARLVVVAEVTPDGQIEAGLASTLPDALEDMIEREMTGRQLSFSF